MTAAIAPKKRRKPPLSRHPLFAGTLALWCAALLAVAALALRLPGGVLVALALAVIGGLAGFAFARRIARPAAPVQRAAEQPAPAEPAEVAAPKIAPEPEILDVASFGIAGFDEPSIEEPRALPVADRAPRVDPTLAPAPASDPAPARVPAMPSAAERLLAADPADLSHLQLLERLALSLDSRGLPAPLPAELVRKLEMVAEAPPAYPARPSENQRPEGAEQALRDALAALQRMSGAA